MQRIKRRSNVLSLDKPQNQITKPKVSFGQNKKFNLNLGQLKINENYRREKRISTFHYQNQDSEQKNIKKTFKFSSTVKKTKKTAKFKNLWITKRGTRNFYIMENQDHILIDQKNKQYRLYGILDGHGKYGKVIAQTSANKISCKYLNEQKIVNKQNPEQNHDKTIKNIISQTNKYVLQNMFKQSSNSGCTLLCILIRDQSIHCFNIGNSRAVLALKPYNSQKLITFPLSSDQNLSRFDEKYRILQSKAIIEELKDQNGCRIGPQRIWRKGQKYPGLYITRSLGMRLSCDLGVISQPQSTCIKIQKNFQFILACSDGFWQVFTNQEAIRYLQSYWRQMNLEQGMEDMLDEAVSRWDKKSELMDDISILIIRL